MPEQPGDRIKIQVTARHDYVPVQSFLTVLSNTLKILRNIDLSTSPNGRRTTRWKISAASLRSPLTVTILGQAKHMDRVEEIGRAYLYGLQMVENDPVSLPPHFNTDSLLRAKKLVSVLNDGVSKVKVSGFQQVLEATQKIAANVDALTAPSYRSYGSIEGKLETATIRGGPQFFIYDKFSDETVQCYFDSSRIEEVRAAWTQRVRVYGEIMYAKTGSTKLIVVEGGVTILRERSELPQGQDIEGIDLTGGMESSSYVRLLREG